MSEDWLVRGSRPLELAEIVRGLGDVLPNLSLRGDRTGHSVVIVHEDLPVAWIGQSREIGDPWAPWVRNEARESGTGAWWTEVTGPTHRSVPGYDVPQLLLRDVALALARTTAGTAVRLSAASLPTPAPGSRRARDTERAEPVPPPVDLGVADAPGDMVNGALAVLVQSRPVVALTPWLVNNHVWASAHDRQFVLITPAATELTLAAWSYLQNTDAAWVVDAGDAMFHGLTGQELDWSGDGFVLLDRMHPGFTPAADDHWRLVVEAETTHPYQDAAVVGAFSRDVLTSAGLESPIRQGLMEPPEAAFDVSELTTYARVLSPRPTRFVLQGPGWEAVCEAVPQPIGVVERVTVSASAHGSLLAGHEVASFLESAGALGAESALLGYRRGSAAGYVPSRLTGPTVPAGLLLSRGRFPTLGDAEARRLGGSALSLDERTARLVWTLDGTQSQEESRGEAPGDPQPNPAVHLVTLLEAVQHHDSHRHAASQPEA